jgi:hypothetical protein
VRDLKGGRVGKTNDGEHEGASRSLLIIQDSPLARQPTLSLQKPSTAGRRLYPSPGFELVLSFIALYGARSILATRWYDEA